MDLDPLLVYHESKQHESKRKIPPGGGAPGCGTYSRDKKKLPTTDFTYEEQTPTKNSLSQVLVSGHSKNSSRMFMALQQPPHNNKESQSWKLLSASRDSLDENQVQQMREHDMRASAHLAPLAVRFCVYLCLTVYFLYPYDCNLVPNFMISSRIYPNPTQVVTPPHTASLEFFRPPKVSVGRRGKINFGFGCFDMIFGVRLCELCFIFSILYFY